MSSNKIQVSGARVNNLKNISLDIPRGKFNLSTCQLAAEGQLKPGNGWQRVAFGKCLLRSYLSRASEDVVISDGLSDMQGSDKQVKWAIDIQDATLDALDYLIGEGQKYKGIPNADAMLNKLASQRDAVAHCEDARDMIDCFAMEASMPFICSGVFPCANITSRTPWRMLR